MKVEKKQPVLLPPPPEYVITLTEKEAVAIEMLVACIFGDVAERKTFHDLFDKLVAAGVVTTSSDRKCFQSVELKYWKPKED